MAEKIDFRFVSAKAPPANVFIHPEWRKPFWIVFTFALHLAFVYLIALAGISRLGGFINGRILPLLGVPSASGSLPFQFIFSHLLSLSLACGAMGGFATAKYQH